MLQPPEFDGNAILAVLARHQVACVVIGNYAALLHGVDLATEDVVNLLHGMGIETGIDLARLVEAGEVAQELIGRKLSGKYLQAALGERDRQVSRSRHAREGSLS